MLSRREKPRRGRIINEEFMEFARAVGCVLRFHHRCSGPVTFHHVRMYGSPKDDTCGFGLCAAAHLHDFGEHSIERLGKRKWEEFWGVSIEGEIAKLRAAWSIRPADKENE